MTEPAPPGRVSILHLEDDPDDAILIQAHLKRAKLDADVRWVSRREDFARALAAGAVDLVLSDYRMPLFNGDDALKFVRDAYPDLPFIMVTGELGEDRAIETLKRGATDYVLKGNLTRLAPAVLRALKDAHVAAERRRAEQELADVRHCLEQELADVRRLHELSTRLLREDDVESALRQVLRACVDLLGADKGNVQILDEDKAALRIVAHVGFDAQFMDRYAGVPAGRGCVCSAALERGERVIAEDVFVDDRFSEVRTEFGRLGLRACVSTPLLGRDRKVYGMLSGHFVAPRRPSKRELDLLDLYVRQAERVIELHRAELKPAPLPSERS